MGIPVVVIRGILESGKTRFIVESLMNKDFGDLGKTLILAQECGEEEYDIEALKKHKIDVCIVENKEDQIIEGVTRYYTIDYPGLRMKFNKNYLAVCSFIFF